MRLRLPRFDDLRLGLPPGWYEVPSHVARDEVERLLELLAGALGGIEDVLECEWLDLDRALELGPTTLVFVTVPEQVERSAVAARFASLPVRFGVYQHVKSGQWPEIAWDEIEVKSALAARLRKWARKPTNPLAPLGMGEFPVDLLVGSTSEPIELLVLAQSTLAYAIRQHEDNQAIDWESCARWAIARRLAGRLFEVEVELRSAVREAIAQSRDGTLAALQHPRELDELVRVGLAHRHEGDAMLVPLARFGADPQIAELLDIEGVTTPETPAVAPAQTRATTPEEAILTFDPLTPVKPGDPWFVDLRAIAPSIRNFGNLFVQQLRRRDRSVRLEILHESGGGATTMMRKLLSELAASGILTIDVPIRPHSEFGFIDLLLHTLSALLVHGEQSEFDIADDVLARLRVWLAGLGLEGELRDYVLGTTEHIRIRSILPVLQRLLADSPERTGVRLALEARCDDLIDHLAQIVEGLRAQLLVRGQRLCLHYQGTARFDLATSIRTFGEHAEDLARLDCHLVFGTTFATKQELSDEARQSTEYHTLTYPRFGEEPVTARGVVYAVLEARADLDRIFVRPQETITQIATNARGNLRHCLELAWFHCQATPGQRLLLLRRRRGLTRAMLARISGISEAIVTQAEDGFEIDAATLSRLAAALGVELDDLMRPGPATIGGLH